MTSLSEAAGDFCQTGCENPTVILVTDRGVFTLLAVASCVCVRVHVWLHARMCLSVAIFAWRGCMRVYSSVCTKIKVCEWVSVCVCLTCRCLYKWESQLWDLIEKQWGIRETVTFKTQLESGWKIHKFCLQLLLNINSFYFTTPTF